MEPAFPPQRSGISVTDKDVATLNNYAEKQRQEKTELSEVMSTVPSIVHRGGIYLVSAVVGFSAIVLYFGRIPVWVNARGALVQDGEFISVFATESGVITEVFAEEGQNLPKDAILVKLNSESPNLNSIPALEQLKALQDIKEQELEIVQEKLHLVQLELQLAAQRDSNNQHYQQIFSHAHQEVANLTQKIEDLHTQIATLQTQIDPRWADGNTITMPQAGLISDLAMVHPGQSVSPGSLVATVISGGDTYIVEANISEQDISSIYVGIEAQIKVDAYSFHQYGSLPAKVNQVIPDFERPGNFIVTLELLEHEQSRDRPEMTLFPGLNVHVEIQTEERRLFELLLSQQ